MQGDVRTAVVLVGGASTRMQPYVSDRPKTMVEVSGRPVIFWVMNWLKSHGIEKVVLGVAYKKEVIIDYVTKNNFGLEIKISEHSVEGETGEGFRLAIERYVDDENFVAMNGDEITNLNLNNLIGTHIESGSVATIAISPMRSPFGIVELYGDNIIGFKEKPLLTDKFVSVGIYVFNKKIRQFLPEKGTIEKMTFPVLAEKNLIRAYKLNANERWATVNTIKDLKIAEEEISLMGFVEKFGGEQ